MRVPVPAAPEPDRHAVVAGIRVAGLTCVPRPDRLPEGSLARIELPRHVRGQRSLRRRLPIVGLVVLATTLVSTLALVLCR